MNKEGFRQWLIDSGMKPRVVSDVLSRVKRVEKAFAMKDPDFSYENEYKKDGGSSLNYSLSCFGKRLPEGVLLPKGAYHMNVIADAVKKYFNYLDEVAKSE